MRYVIGLSFAALAVWALQATGILMALMMFFLIGAIPGTHDTIPPMYMLIVLTLSSIGVLYWLFRQRPVRQIQEMKRAYHEQTDTKEGNQTPTHTPERSLLQIGFDQSYAGTRTSVQHAKMKMSSSVHRTVNNITKKTSRAAQPIKLSFLASATILFIAFHEITTWAKPYLRRFAAWIRKQASYSLKGTMLSAHKWSSLSKKLFSSLTSLLKRCNSVLKRGRSLLIRSAR